MLGMKKGNERIKSVSMLKIEIHNSWVIIIWVICHWIRLWNENHSLLCIRREFDWRKISFESNYLFQCRPYAFLTMSTLRYYYFDCIIWLRVTVCYICCMFSTLISIHTKISVFYSQHWFDHIQFVHCFQLLP